MRISLRSAPFVRTAAIGISHARYKDGRIGINLPSPLDSLCLCGLVITDPAGIRPPDGVVAFASPFDEQFATHMCHPSTHINSYVHPLVLPQLMQR